MHRILCKRHTQIVNFISESPEIYLKCSAFIPFLNFQIVSMDTRFNQRFADVLSLERLKL